MFPMSCTTCSIPENGPAQKPCSFSAPIIMKNHQWSNNVCLSTKLRWHIAEWHRNVEMMPRYLSNDQAMFLQDLCDGCVSFYLKLASMAIESGELLFPVRPKISCNSTGHVWWFLVIFSLEVRWIRSKKEGLKQIVLCMFVVWSSLLGISGAGLHPNHGPCLCQIYAFFCAFIPWIVQAGAIG